MIGATASKRFEEEGAAVRRCGNGAAPTAGRVPASGRQRVASERRGFILATWANLLCLDAPLVAVSWQWLFAREVGVTVTASGTAALFLTAWVIYLADRFGDCLSVNGNGALSLRQRFCIRHRSAWLIAVAAVAFADLLVCATLGRQTLIAGAAVGALALGYLIVNQLTPTVWRILPMKEVTIGFVFAAGTITPLYRSLTTEWLPAWVLFGSLCSLNCISIAIWERHLDAAQQRISIATAFPTSSRYLRAALLLLVATCFALAVSDGQLWRVYFCVAASAFLLWSLDWGRDYIHPDIRTALADLVLLTPVLALLADFVVRS